ncbi:MAG: SpoIIE family protein phosphatase [Bacteroidota bacterium]|nr:SpoIIE family protein phosphatase [Bacteroidota bacterium]
MSTESPRGEREQRYDLHALYQASRMLSSSFDLDYVLRNLVLSTMSKLLVTRGVVLLQEPEGPHWRVAVTRGLPKMAMAGLITLPVLPDAEIWTREQVPPDLAAQGLVLVMPIQSGGRHIGLFALGSKVTGETFTETELEYVQSLVHMSAAAIANSMMIRELREANQDLASRVQQLKTLFELSQEFNATVDKDRVVKQFAFAMLGHMAARRYVFYLRSDSGQFRQVAAQAVQDNALPAEFLSGLNDLVNADNAALHPELRKQGFVLAMPIRLKDQVQGILCMGPKWTHVPYTPEDIEFLYSLGSLAVMSIQNVDLIEERIEKQRLQEEMRMARSIQKRLLPGRIPQTQRLQIASIALPSREVGGDYFDVLRLTDNRLLVMVADVTGKGMPAALLMSTIHACTHLMRPMKMTLVESIEETNRVVYDNTDPDKFITAFASIYYADGTLAYVNAGHEPPMLIRSDGTVEHLSVGGPLLGVMPNLRYTSGKISLRPGDAVVLFTDGVTEAMGANMEEYTESRLQALVIANRHCSAPELVQRIQDDIEAFTGPVQALSDDRTLLVLKAVN